MTEHDAVTALVEEAKERFRDGRKPFTPTLIKLARIVEALYAEGRCDYSHRGTLCAEFQEDHPSWTVKDRWCPACRARAIAEEDA